MKQFPNVKETYTSDGKYQVRRFIQESILAETYRKKLQRGRDEFYKGEIAKTISGFIKEKAVFLAMKILQSPLWVDPVSTNYRGYDVWELPPNGQGMAALQMLNIIEGYDFSDIPFGSAKNFTLSTKLKNWF
jgi:gamma-glutamyltranspeptidase/glutathione hydrolase